MKIDKALILKLENLARIQLSASENAAIEKDLNRILEMVGKMDELDLDEVEPLIHLTEAVNVLRPDKVSNQIGREEALKGAPKQDGTHFLLPKVVEKGKDH